MLSIALQAIVPAFGVGGALTASLTSGAPQASESATSDWAGLWQGGLRVELEWYAARVDFRATNGRIVGVLDIPALDAKGALAELRTEGEAIRLVIETAETGKLELGAKLAGNTLRSASGGNWSSPAFQLVKTAELSARDLDECSGWYELEPGRTVLVARGSEGGLRFFHGDSAGTLMPLARDRFLVVYKDAEPGPPRNEVRFARDSANAVRALEFDDDGDRTEARRLREDRIGPERVAFQNGGIEFGGLLLRPKADKPTPAVVFIAGTGYSTADRWYEISLARRLVDKGLAVLLFDKRGCGSSGGAWRTSTLADLASDAIAAARSLQGREEIDRRAIGLWGVSEGGWVAPLAASMCPELAFIVDHGGPAVPPLEDELDDLTSGIESLGFEAEDQEIALALARALVALYRSHAAVPAFEAALERARRRPWFERFQARIPQREDDWRVQWWRKRGLLDSVKTWEQLRLPALVLIGGEDATMNLQKNLERFEAFRSGNARLEIRVVPDADHGLRIGGQIVESAIDGAAKWIWLATGS